MSQLFPGRQFSKLVILRPIPPATIPPMSQASLREYSEFFERFSAQPLHYEEVKGLKDNETWQMNICAYALLRCRLVLENG